MNDLYALFRQSLAGLRVLILATIVLGIAYPLLVTGISLVAFPWQAHGSLVTADGSPTTDPDRAVGSAIIGQIAPEGLFQPRPSAAGDGYDLLSTYGTNYGPEAPELIASITDTQATIAEREGVAVSDIPPDAVTASGSGLDPHISPAYAALQVDRVARANGLDVSTVEDLVADHTEGRTLGTLGEPRVNVLELNLAVLRAARG
ncbi:K(+)-transporting ATPase subunit C [Nocardioides taihuensis]|uniref:Potassium-transporting ATPase KdpC subunit n=1 Tax=Nocardioides taihuensis TaxID=1835606 RepID=A0ABW0BEA0_9ACTN